MESYQTQERIWRVLARLLRPILKAYLGLSMEALPDTGPALIICNHVTNLDPVLFAMSSPRQMTIFVASENILRGRPLLHRLLYWTFAPISRRKGASAVDTCRKMIKTLRSGKSVCLFAEGETTWNGKTFPIKPGTEVLVRAAGAPLVTYCMRGGYFTAPRWGKGLRRGKITGHVTGVYTAEQVRAMTPEEVRHVMEEGIREDAFQRQHREMVAYRGKHRLDGAETLLFLCPRCHGIGTLLGKNNAVTCRCGLTVSFDACLLPLQPSPFPDLCAWDEWQTAAFAQRITEEPGLVIEDSRAEIRLWKIAPDNSMTEAARGKLSMDRNAFTVGDLRFPLEGIRDIALLQRRKAAFTFENDYYELESPVPLCLRKYVVFWQTVRQDRKQS